MRIRWLWIVLTFPTWLALFLPSGNGIEPKRPPNIVFMMADDLAAVLGCDGHPLAKTPCLDALAKRGVVFERAYCQDPVCNPSRASLLSGLAPNTTRVTVNADDLFQNLPDVVTLPHQFRQHGYETMRSGKIFHVGVPSGIESRDDPKAWVRGTPFKDEHPYPKARPSEVKVKTAQGSGLPWAETTGTDDDLVDGNFARTAIAWLKDRDKSKPFFLAVGFHRPHLPFVAPAKYFDLYPIDSIKFPNEPKGHEENIPLPARNGSIPGYALTATPDQRRAAIRGYLACVSYMDAQAGRVLDALKELGLDNNTIIIFTSDHGWHLGEHGLWHKRSLFEECARVPLIVAAPGAKGNGQKSKSLVELLDLFPTLCDLAGVPAPTVLQGKSLRPVLDDPTAKVHEAAVTQTRRGPMAENRAEDRGRSIRTERWRCTEWDEGRSGIELYDHDADPHEYRNLAADQRHATVLSEHRKLLASKAPAMK